MPTPKPQESSSKSNAPESSTGTDVPPDYDGDVSAYSDNFKGVWAVAHKGVPQVQGAEKLLNKVGGSITIPRPRYREGVDPVLNFIGKRVSKIL